MNNDEKVAISSGAEEKDEDIFSYCEHLNALHSDFNQRFDDILKMNIPDWILDPFSSANTEESPQVQEELMEDLLKEGRLRQKKSLSFEGSLAILTILAIGFLLSPVRNK
ncbi:hypothetical protein J437_LFUL014989 [Ladona fulva]|uniref:Uncharacterized protein n=1 Tax=Ladona fulva TaxID=123851 RepID=A0A8K0KMF7_LADFU|nr:hypothetical protein J437_LFUL014989 [Ladona fulva]